MTTITTRRVEGVESCLRKKPIIKADDDDSFFCCVERPLQARIWMIITIERTDDSQLRKACAH